MRSGIFAGMIAWVVISTAALGATPERNAVLAQMGELSLSLRELEHAVEPFLLDPDFTPQLLSEVKEYEASIFREQKSWDVETVVTETDVRHAIQRARVVLLGDRHNIEPLQRRAEATLEFLQQSAPGPKLFLFELIDASYQPDVDAYFAGTLTAEELHIRVKWEENIGYAWDSYLKLLNWLRDHGVKTIVALRPDPAMNIYDLNTRNQYVLDRVSAELKADPLLQAVVLQGYLHFVGETHLADAFERAFPGQTVLLQCDQREVHLKLLEREIPVDANLFVKLRGASNPNTYYSHFFDPMAGAVSIVEWISGGVSADAEETKSVQESASQIAKEFNHAVSLMNAGQDAEANETLSRAKALVGPWLDRVRAIQKPSKVEPELLPAVERFASSVSAR